MRQSLRPQNCTVNSQEIVMCSLDVRHLCRSTFRLVFAQSVSPSFSRVLVECLTAKNAISHVKIIDHVEYKDLWHLKNHVKFRDIKKMD